jgi:dihydrofolate reductase
MASSVIVALVVACADNGVIGKDGKMPWHIPADLQHFKKLTLGKPVLMGRKTYDSIGRPLPRRTNIVITRDPHWRMEGVQVAQNLATGLALAYEEAHHSGVDEVMVIGGGEVYRQCLTEARHIYLTEIHHAYDGDATFSFAREGWRETAREDHPADGDAPAYSFVTLTRA